MRKGRDGEWKKKWKKKIMVKIVATTSLPVDRLTATDCNAAARAKINKESRNKYRELKATSNSLKVTSSKSRL